ncbi:hypothetical protein ABID47_004977 [Paenibacillus favisporus]|uniref:Uncharacterized protein n=1 Tax=Paenibacillus favisporus TaxID=221028 RepID=A0ABV2F9B2_9BACL
MKTSRKLKIKIYGILSLAIIGGMLTSVSSVSAGSGASASASMWETSGYLEGGVTVFAGHDFVPGTIRAYYELYRDGTFLGSKQAESTNYYLDKSATALITSKTHSQSGLYTMTWAGRVGGYYWNGSDWTDAGEESFYLN